jgi:hypothetical protein
VGYTGSKKINLVDFHNVVALELIAEICGQLLKKVKKVFWKEDIKPDWLENT